MRTNRNRLVFLCALLALAGLVPASAQTPRPPVAAPVAARRAPAYYGVYLKETKLGSLTLARERVLRERRPAIRTETRMVMDLAVLGRPSRIVSENITWSDPRTGAPLALRSRSQTAGRVTLVDATFTADTLRYRAEIQGESKRGVFRLRPGERFLADPSGGGTPPAPKTRQQGKVFITDTFQLVDSEIEVAGRETILLEGRRVLAFKVLDKNPMAPGTLYVDAAGALLRADVALGMQIRRESRAMALSGSASAPDLAALVGIAPAGAPLADPRALRRSVFALGGVTRPLPPDDNVQTVTALEGVADPEVAPREKNEKTLRVTVMAEGLPQIPTAPLFARRGDAPERLRPFLKPTVYVPADSAEFQALARRVLEGETDAGRAAARIAAYVHAALRPDASIATVRTARDILKDPRGVCRDYTTLFATLARAAGLPAKQCVGLAYVNDRFLYHAWPEVWIGTDPATGRDRWVALEPTWGEPFADATHLKLAEGEITDIFQIAADMTRYRVKVLEAQ